MSTIKGLSEKNRNLLFELVKEIKSEGYAEGFEAGKLVASNDSTKEKSPQVAGTTSEVKKNQMNLLLDANCIAEIAFPMISTFENGVYINNGNTEILHTENQIISRPYQPYKSHRDS